MAMQVMDQILERAVNLIGRRRVLEIDLATAFNGQRDTQIS